MPDQLLYITKPPSESSSLRYTTRAETRPEGSDAVDRVHVSGTDDRSRGSVNQLWNWVKGDVEREDRVKVPT